MVSTRQRKSIFVGRYEIDCCHLVKYYAVNYDSLNILFTDPGPYSNSKETISNRL